MAGGLFEGQMAVHKHSLQKKAGTSFSRPCSFACWQAVMWRTNCLPQLCCGTTQTVTEHCCNGVAM